MGSVNSRSPTWADGDTRSLGHRLHPSKAPTQAAPCPQWQGQLSPGLAGGNVRKGSALNTGVLPHSGSSCPAQPSPRPGVSFGFPSGRDPAPAGRALSSPASVLQPASLPLQPPQKLAEASEPLHPTPLSCPGRGCGVSRTQSSARSPLSSGTKGQSPGRGVGVG